MIFTGPLLAVVDLAKFIFDCIIVAKYKKENSELMEKYNTSHEHTPAYGPGHPVFCCTGEDGKPNYSS